MGADIRDGRESAYGPIEVRRQALVGRLVAPPGNGASNAVPAHRGSESAGSAAVESGPRETRARTVAHELLATEVVMWAAVLHMRRAPQLGQTPRPLHEKATRRSFRQSSQCRTGAWQRSRRGRIVRETRLLDTCAALVVIGCLAAAADTHSGLSLLSLAAPSFSYQARLDARSHGPLCCR